LASSSQSRTRRCVRRSKKRNSPLPPQAVGDPSRAGRRIRVEDGSSPGPLRRALRSETPCRLLRGETLPTVGRGHRSAADGAREGETLRLRIRAEGYGSRALMAFEPLKGYTKAKVTEHRRKVEFAEMMRHLADDLYPNADRIRLVVDNLRARTPRPPSTRASLQSRPGVWPRRSSSSTRPCTAHG
jgi:hypothetical protein